jgi:hypothetical protein
LSWLLLVASVSGNHGALRLRQWRAVRSLGAAALRDGVYIAPATDSVRAAFRRQAAEVIKADGTAFVFGLDNVAAEEHDGLVALFDRSTQYEKLNRAIDALASEIADIGESEARRRLRQLSRDFSAVEAIDYFAGKARETAAAALAAVRRAVDDAYSPEEPSPIYATIPKCKAADFQNKVWATRAHPWVDRICSAWLIRRFIDPHATLLWLQHASDCPDSAIGFDFDGARFTHIDQYVTFEVLLRGFALDGDDALQRIAAFVHYLDVGGNRVPEAGGFETILTGARDRCASDEALLDYMSTVLDDMYRGFQAAGTRSPR